MRIPSGTTDQVVYFVAVDATDFTTRETGLTTFTAYRARNGAAAAAMTTPTVTEVDSTNMPGVYSLLLDEDMTIGSGNDSEEMVFHITHSGMAPVTRTIELYRPKITLGSTSTAQTGDSYARLGAPAGASVSADIATIDGNVDSILTDTGTTLPASIATIDGNVDSILTDTGTTLPATLATIDGNVDAILVDTGTTLPASISALNDLSQADIRTAVGLASANLDTQIAALPTAAENRAEMDSNSTQLAAIVADTNELQTDDVPGLIATVDTVVDAIKAKTDSLTFTNTGVVDANITHVISDPVVSGSSKETNWGGTE